MADLPVTLILSAPDREAVSVRCDSVHLIACDSRDGRHAGGSVGIRRGHVPALIAVAPGPVRAFAEGREIFSSVTSGGLASVAHNRVTLMTERFSDTLQP
ncbi:MAG: hypothetical protein K6A33_12825 [Clostridiales bacterium]|nr:hypothetical protein [Clostridiales bacterium]